MEQEIKSIIEKSLPAHVGEVLQKRLKKADDDEKSLCNANEAIENLTKQVSRLSAENESLKKEKSADKEVLARIGTLQELERDRKVFEAETKLECEKSKNKDLNNFVGMVFKSPVYKNSISQWKTYSDEWDSDHARNVKKVSSVNTEEQKTEE